MNMIERVARASFDCWRKSMNDLGLHLDKGLKFEDMSEHELEFAYSNARACIAAMREPTEEMIAIGVLYRPDATFPDEVKEMYYKMIAAALKD